MNLFYFNRDSSKNDLEIVKHEKRETRIDSSTVTFVEGAGGLEKSKSDSKLNQVRLRLLCMLFDLFEVNLLHDFDETNKFSESFG